jgi:sec-independent protein translocase protein TatA
MSFGVWEIALLALIGVLIFGAGRLPKVMGDLGRGVASLKGGLKDAVDGVAPAAADAQPVVAARLEPPGAAAGVGEEPARR